MNSANPADFEAYLAQFPNGVFRALAENRLAALRAPRRPGEVFRDCDACPEMVVLPGGGLALGRYEVTVGEYRAFATATGGGAAVGAMPHVMASGPTAMKIRGESRAFRRRIGIR